MNMCLLGKNLLIENYSSDFQWIELIKRKKFCNFSKIVGIFLLN